MNLKILVKILTIFLISIVLNYLVPYVINIYFPSYDIASKKIIPITILAITLIWLFYTIFFSRTNNYKAFLNIFLWFIVFFIIIFLYAFRFELNYLTKRVISVIIPSYAWVNNDGEIVIARNSDGHFYLDAYINGQIVHFMVDTGASDVALTIKDAINIGYDITKLDYNRTYNTANGISRAAPIKLQNIRIYDAEFENIEAHISDVGLDISLLGMSLISKFKIFKIDKDFLILSY
jgi:aspartyl protease family protein